MLSFSPDFIIAFDKGTNQSCQIVHQVNPISMDSIELQSILERVYQAPENFSFELQGDQVYLSRSETKPIFIRQIETGDIPEALRPNLKIKSWRLNKSERQGLSLSLKLIV